MTQQSRVGWLVPPELQGSRAASNEVGRAPAAICTSGRVPIGRDRTCTTIGAFDLAAAHARMFLRKRGRSTNSATSTSDEVKAM
jgi:hypothetical protein